MKYIGITQRVEEVTGRKERRDCLDQEWTKLVIKTGTFPLPLPNCLQEVESLFTSIPLSGVILTGGNDLCHISGATNTAPERDLLEAKLIEMCKTKNTPLLAVCRGMQMMVHHYGGKLIRVEDHVAKNHDLNILDNTIIPLEQSREVNSFHNFGVLQKDIGVCLKALATAPDGTVEAVLHKDLPQYGIMWHPERDPFDNNDVTILNKIFT